MMHLGTEPGLTCRAPPSVPCWSWRHGYCGNTLRSFTADVKVRHRPADWGGDPVSRRSPGPARLDLSVEMLVEYADQPAEAGAAAVLRERCQKEGEWPVLYRMEPTYPTTDYLVVSSVRHGVVVEVVAKRRKISRCRAYFARNDGTATTQGNDRKVSACTLNYGGEKTKTNLFYYCRPKWCRKDYICITLFAANSGLPQLCQCRPYCLWSFAF